MKETTKEKIMFISCITGTLIVFLLPAILLIAIIIKTL